MAEPNRRVLIVDDNTAIHDDFRKVLGARRSNVELEALESALFGESAAPAAHAFELAHAEQGQAAVEMVRGASDAGRPFAVAFIDIRMPPGLDGVETTRRIWEIDPNVQVVICSAYSDYSWEQMQAKLGVSHRLLILKKPFDPIEAQQLAHALTEKWELLQSSRRTVEELETAVAMRTRSLESTNVRLLDEVRRREATEAMLVRSQKLEALGRIAGGIAHEINNPLAVVLSNLRFVDSVLRELESAKPMPEDLTSASGEALECAERIRRIVREVRMFARSEAAEIAAVEPERIVRAALTSVRKEARADIEISLELEPTASLLGREEALVQVVYNLLSNAVAATTKAKHVTVGVARQADRIGISVTDDGVGIPVADMSRIFEPFFTTKDQGQGTGLGLSICHGIVTSLGGEITVESTPGAGSTFRVLLPIAPSAAAHAVIGRVA